MGESVVIAVVELLASFFPLQYRRACTRAARGTWGFGSVKRSTGHLMHDRQVYDAFREVVAQRVTHGLDSTQRDLRSVCGCRFADPFYCCPICGKLSDMQFPKATKLAVAIALLAAVAGCGTREADTAASPSAVAVPSEVQNSDHEFATPGTRHAAGQLDGIDISKYEPDYAAETVPADFVILRASRGVNEIDETVAAKYALAKAAGRLVGLYHYSDADFGNDPVVEADIFVAGARELGAIGEAILVLDHEEDSEAVGGPEWALAFLDRVKETTGVTPLIYGSRGSLCQDSYAQVAAKYPLWVARYVNGWEPMYGYQSDVDPGSVAPWESPTLFQYTPMGFLPGLDEELDVNVFYGTEADWHALAAADSPSVE